MTGLILCDLDGTVIASPRCEHTPEGFAAWERSIIDSPPPPVPGAIEGLRRLMWGGASLRFVTARSVRLAAATKAWIERHAPGIKCAGISMTPQEITFGGRVYKAARIVRFAAAEQGPVLLVDDDAEMAHALRNGDLFMHAPSCWR